MFSDITLQMDMEFGGGLYEGSLETICIGFIISGNDGLPK